MTSTDAFPASADATQAPGAQPFQACWVRAATRKQQDHWTVDGIRGLCGEELPHITGVLSDIGIHPNVSPQRNNGDPAVRACPACQNAVIKLAFKIPFEIGDTVVSRAMGMVLYGKVTGYAVHDDQPVLDLERFWVSRPTSESEEKERRESGIHNWYRTVNECQAWAPRSGFVRPHPGGRLHWREGNVLLCRRNADATAFTEGTNPHSRQHLDDCCSSCRAELKRRASAQIKHHKEWPATSNDLTLTPGQRVTVLHQGPGTVQGPSKLSGRIAVALGTEMGPPFVVNRFPDQLTPLEDARVTTETTTKKARKSKAGADVAPVDFKKLAEETRTKMAAKPAPAKAKRKPVRQLHFQPGDFVSYRRGSSYLTALVREVREGGYALELPQDHPVNGQWQVEATVEEVTPRVLPLSLVAPLAVGDRVARALFGPDLVPLSIEGDCVVQVVTADGEVLIRNEQGQQWQGVPDQRLTLCGRADLNTALRDLGRPSVESSEEAAPPAPHLRFQVGDVVGYETAENGEKVERVALVRRELLDGQYGDYLVTVVDEHSLEVQRRDDEDWDVMVNESRMNIIYPSGEMDWKPEILALVPELGWTRAALKATNPALLPEPATEPAPNLPEPEEETDQVVISRAPLELPDTPVLLEIFSPTAPVDLEKLQALRTLPAEGGVIALSPALPEPGMLGTFDLPLDITEDSPFNVRHYREPEKVEALAASLKAEGQLQECAGRWTSAGRVEIFMGGTRRAAQLLRAAQGEKGLTLRVTIRQATDAQALRISTLENKSRNDLTPLEDCESVHLLLKAGETPESLRLMFGYKTAQPILDRQVIATNLHTVGRDLLEQGRLSLSQAAVIARASGADLQEQMIQQATRGGADSSAEALSRQLTRGQILVRDVPFDVDRSGLAVKQDAFDTYPAYFADKVKALNAVVQWANEQARREEVTGDRAFCHVVTGESSVWNPHVRGKYEGCTPDDDGAGRVYYVCTTSGKVTVEDGVRQIMKAAPTPAAPAPASAGRPVPATSTASHEAAPEQAAKRREFPETFFHHCHQLRADAARTAALQRPHAMLAMTVAGLIMGPDTSTERDKGGVSLTEISGAPGSSAHLRAPLPDALETRHQAMLEVLRPAARGNAPTQGVYVLGGPQRTPYDRAVLLNILLGLREDALMEFLLTLTAMAAYDWSGWSPRTQAAAHYQVFAREVEADTLLAQNFTLTDQHLKYYPRHELVALAEEAGLGRALVEDCKTTKQMRGRILEHADHLRRKGFVPRHVRFEEAKK